MFIMGPTRIPFSMRTVCMTVAVNVECCHTVYRCARGSKYPIISNQLDVLWLNEIFFGYEIPLQCVPLIRLNKDWF